MTDSIPTEAGSLKPCPFCGGTLIFIEPDETGSGGQRVAPYHVGCSACKAEQCHDELETAIALWNRRSSGEPAAELAMSQEPKYTTRAGKLVNRASGEAIPDDEPVFIFRGRDRKALKTLEFYTSLCQDTGHRRAIYKRMEQFELFAQQWPSRMKEPDTSFSTTKPAAAPRGERPGSNPPPPAGPKPAPPPNPPEPRAELARLRRIADLVGRIYVYGGFKAETCNERELESLLRTNGTFWESIAAFESERFPETKGDGA